MEWLIDEIYSEIIYRMYATCMDARNQVTSCQTVPTESEVKKEEEIYDNEERRTSTITAQ